VALITCTYTNWESGYLSQYSDGLRAGRPWLYSQQCNIVLSSTASIPNVGPPTPLSNGYRGLFPWAIKRQGYVADHSPPSSTEVKKSGAILHTPTYIRTKGRLYICSYECYHGYYIKAVKVLSSVWVTKDAGLGR
jgi:hypothetical protein